jgi:hypothetical protein
VTDMVISDGICLGRRSYLTRCRDWWVMLVVGVRQWSDMMFHKTLYGSKEEMKEE